MTFSIVARCPHSGALGVAVSTAVPAVGAMCPYVRPAIGAVSTQSWVNPYLAIKALELLAEGHSAAQALEKVLSADEKASLRQVGIVAANGASAAWTGANCTDWAGQRTGPGYAIQGNMLTGQETLEAMEASFLTSDALSLAERLLLALEAGQGAGGDKRGRQSASLLVYRDEPYPWLDLRVDEHTEPVAELPRVFGVAMSQLVPFVENMPSKANPAGVPPREVSDMLSLPPALRPGANDLPAQAVGLAQELAGTGFDAERFNANLEAFRPVLAEIRKLRQLDLADVHPAVLFDPTTPWRKERS